eukprot:TRINITY_DN4335_c0_g1_i1.p1 TRINITY_DN4335_c0_g1~~TRINITY_DN4335_c0_g1_i1.p1  ORF type:complete len:401 (+),score=163.55 TRINITY_DN4335_c0_g1_i1:99-1301(+)
MDPPSPPSPSAPPDPAPFDAAVAGAMDVLMLAVKQRALSEVQEAALVEWGKALRDALRENASQRREGKKEARAVAKEERMAKVHTTRAEKAEAKQRRTAEKRAAAEVYQEVKAVRGRAKAERKIELAVKHLWQLKPEGGGEAPPALLGADWDAVDYAASQLDAAVAARGDAASLVPEDCPAVEQLGKLLSVVSTLSDGLPSALRVDEVPGVMARCVIHDGDAVMARLHLFPAVGETYVHNHRNSFASMCLYGAYTHTIWTVADAAGAHHYASVRAADGTLGEPVKTPGALVPGNAYTHSTNKVYFLDREAVHTVTALDEGVAPGRLLPGALTLYVKGKADGGGEDGAPFKTRVLSEERAAIDADAAVADRVLEGEEKDRVLRCMQDMLRMAAAEHLRREV